MKKRLAAALLAGIMSACLLLTGCGSSGSAAASSESSEETSTESESSADESSSETEDISEDSSTEGGSAQEEDADHPEISGLTYESSLPLDYAECFAVHYYNDGYTLIDVIGDRQYLLIPEGKEAPEGIDETIILIQQPLKKIYLAATSAMALFDAADAMDSIAFSSLEASGWYVDAAKEAMEEGRIQYAGKYNKPDYELLVNEGCDLAIESTMILHTPKVQEMIEKLDIPVFIDRSSYESEPLGRTEWIKAYGVMTGTLDQAEAFFESRKAVLSEMGEVEADQASVVYFYINTSGEVIIRNKSDYISRMIELGGGRILFEDMNSDSASVPVTMEEFYSVAKDADHLIYNASIDATVTSIADLTAKNELFADFKAVQEGNVWSTGKSLYQATDNLTDFILDVNRMITGGDESEMTFLYKLS